MPFIIPHIFHAGEKAIAEEVNNNFDYLKQSLESVNGTLNSKIDTTENALLKNIQTLQEESELLSTIIDTRDTIVRLGTIVPPDPLEDGSIPTAQITLEADRIHTAAVLANSELILPTLESNTKFVNCLLEFTLGSNCSLVLPVNVNWLNDQVPELIADGVTTNKLFFDTTSGSTNWMGYFVKGGI